MKKGLIDFLLRHTDNATISAQFCMEAAQRFGAALKEIEIAALQAQIVPQKYERNIGKFGTEGQVRLLRSAAAVAGCGGLGGWICQILARCGIGTLVIADCDTFAESNLNRQVFCTSETLGRCKAESTAEELKKINSSVDVQFHNTKITAENGERIFGGCDIVVDALDSNESRRQVLQVCKKLNLPFIHGAIGGMYARTRAIFPEEISTAEKLFADDGERELTNLPYVAAICASLQSIKAVDILLGRKETENRLIWLNLEDMEMTKIKI